MHSSAASPHIRQESLVMASWFMSRRRAVPSTSWNSGVHTVFGGHNAHALSSVHVSHTLLAEHVAAAAGQSWESREERKTRVGESKSVQFWESNAHIIADTLHTTVRGILADSVWCSAVIIAFALDTNATRRTRRAA